MPLDLPDEFVLFDTEFTSWEGAKDRCWLNLGEHRELMQIAAMKVKNLESGDEYSEFVKPQFNPELSEFIMELTGISQSDVDGGRLLAQVLPEFAEWVGGLPMYCYGTDGKVIAENCWLYGIDNPIPFTQVHDVRELLDTHGIDYSKYTSGILPKAFGAEPEFRAHDALHDVKNMLVGLKLLAKEKE